MRVLKVFTFSGSASAQSFRSVTLWAVAALFAANAMAVGSVALIGPTPAQTAAMPVFFAIAGATFCWVLLAQSVRRCRDLGWPAAVCLLYLLPGALLALPLVLATVRKED